MCKIKRGQSKGISIYGDWELLLFASSNVSFASIFILRISANLIDRQFFFLKEGKNIYKLKLIHVFFLLFSIYT